MSKSNAWPTDSLEAINNHPSPLWRWSFLCLALNLTFWALGSLADQYGLGEIRYALTVFQGFAFVIQIVTIYAYHKQRRRAVNAYFMERFGVICYE